VADALCNLVGAAAEAEVILLIAVLVVVVKMLVWLIFIGIGMFVVTASAGSALYLTKRALSTCSRCRTVRVFDCELRERLVAGDGVVGCS
jgi:hypothetical protein